MMKLILSEWLAPFESNELSDGALIFQITASESIT